MILKDRFSLLDHPEEYSEGRIEKLRELYHSNTPEGKILRDSVTKDAEEEDEHEEFRIEDPDSWYARMRKEEKKMKKKNLGRLSLGTSRIRKTIPTIERSD